MSLIDQWMQQISDQERHHGKTRVFISHEFRSRDLRVRLERSLTRRNLQPYFADNEVTSDLLLHKVCKKILVCRASIVDLTHANPNVYFELGVAIGLNKPIFLVLKQGTAVPPLLGGIDPLKFNDYKDLETKLVEHIPGWLEQSIKHQMHYTTHCQIAGKICPERQSARPQRQYLVIDQVTTTEHTGESAMSHDMDMCHELKPALERFEFTPVFLDEVPLDNVYRLCDYCRSLRQSSFALCHLSHTTTPNTYLLLGLVTGIGIDSLLLVSEKKDEHGKNLFNLPSMLLGLDSFRYTNYVDISEYLGNRVEGFLNQCKSRPKKGSTLPSGPFSWRERAEEAAEAGENVESEDEETTDEIPVALAEAYAAIDVARESGDPAEQAATIRTTMAIFAEHGDTEGVRHALTLAQSIADVEEQTGVLVDMVWVLADMHDSVGLRRIVEIALAIELPVEQGEVLRTVAQAYRGMGDEEKAAGVDGLVSSSDNLDELVQEAVEELVALSDNLDELVQEAVERGDFSLDVDYGIKQIRGSAEVSFTNPDTVLHSQQLVLRYKISNGLDREIPAWLGAHLYNEGEYLFHRYEDAEIVLLPGEHIYQRVLTIDENWAAGEYFVHAEANYGVCSEPRLSTSLTKTWIHFPLRVGKQETSEQVSTAELRQLLNRTFNSEEIDTLCFDYFRPVYEQFTAGMSKDQKIQELIAYCERQGEEPRLLEIIESIRPEFISVPKTPTPETQRRLRVFLSYAREDEDTVLNLYQRLQADGFQPWMDKEDLMPGQKWEEAILKAVREADVFLSCVSQHSVNKTGFINREINYALEIADEQPYGAIFIIPLRLEKNCPVPERLMHLQWCNLFEDDGYDVLLRALQVQAQQVGALAPTITGHNSVSKDASKHFNVDSPDTAKLREWLHDVFDEDELDSFCFDHFRSVYNRFALGMSRTRKIQVLIEHCDQQNKLLTLLNLMRQQKPSYFGGKFMDNTIRGSVHRSEGDYDRAIEEFTQALWFQPVHADTYYSSPKSFVSSDYTDATWENQKVSPTQTVQTTW